MAVSLLFPCMKSPPLSQARRCRSRARVATSRARCCPSRACCGAARPDKTTLAELIAPIGLRILARAAAGSIRNGSVWFSFGP